MSSYNRGYNEDLFKARKTRMESLDDRIKNVINTMSYKK